MRVLLVASLLAVLQPAQQTISMWHLAEMAGQGEYFVLKSRTYENGIACVLAAKELDETQKFWRYICVEVP